MEGKRNNPLLLFKFLPTTNHPHTPPTINSLIPNYFSLYILHKPTIQIKINTKNLYFYIFIYSNPFFYLVDSKWDWVTCNYHLKTEIGGR